VFGELKVRKILLLTKMETPDQAVAKLLEFTEYPQISRWYQFPTALLILVGETVSGTLFGAPRVADGIFQSKLCHRVRHPGLRNPGH
jgi:hypothetical protein